MKRRLAIMVLGLSLGACGSGDSDRAETGATASNMAEVAAAEPANAQTSESGTPGLGACPFRDTSEWNGSVEGGRLLVNGRVDLMMAGFTPTLTKRAGAAPGTLALDLALVPEAGAAVDARPRYTERGAPAYRRGEIYCGGAKIADVDMVLIG